MSHPNDHQSALQAAGQLGNSQVSAQRVGRPTPNPNGGGNGIGACEGDGYANPQERQLQNEEPNQNPNREMEEITTLTEIIDRRIPIMDSKSFLISFANILECIVRRGTL